MGYLEDSDTAMTHEFFINICKMIKAGSKTLVIPCCANCMHYINGLARDYEYVCEHPDGGWVLTKPEDFCSYFEERRDG